MLLINDDIIIDSKSGYSGAGKTKKTEDLIKEVDENIKSYGVGDHSHISEINQEINKSRDEINIEIFFSANLIPVKSGILSNIYIKPDNLIKGAAGQAIQNFNIMNNFDEKLGIE